MSFNDNAPLDPSQVQDRRGMGRGPMIGGGIGGGIILLLAALFGINPQLLEGLAGTTQDPQSQSQGSAPACQTGADADARLDCRITGTVNSLNAFWPAYLAQYNTNYPRPKAVIFAGGTTPAAAPLPQKWVRSTAPLTRRRTSIPASSRNSWTGSAPPADRWHRNMWWPTNSAITSRTSWATSTVRSRIPRAPDPGVSGWSSRPTATRDCGPTMPRRQPDPKTGQPYLEPFTDQDVQDALSAASAVGDDRIQKAATGRVSPEAWTHGSSAQRQKWFYQGYTTGDINKCDTFAVATP